MKRIILLLIITSNSILTASPSEVEYDGPQLFFEDEVCDLGIIGQNKINEGKFTFINTGPNFPTRLSFPTPAQKPAPPTANTTRKTRPKRFITFSPKK